MVHEAYSRPIRPVSVGAAARVRTGHLGDTKPALFLLSYGSMVSPGGLQPPISRLGGGCSLQAELRGPGTPTGDEPGASAFGRPRSSTELWGHWWDRSELNHGAPSAIKRSEEREHRPVDDAIWGWSHSGFSDRRCDPLSASVPCWGDVRELNSSGQGHNLVPLPLGQRHNLGDSSGIPIGSSGEFRNPDVTLNGRALCL